MKPRLGQRLAAASRRDGEEPSWDGAQPCDGEEPSWDGAQPWDGALPWDGAQPWHRGRPAREGGSGRRSAEEVVPWRQHLKEKADAEAAEAEDQERAQRPWKVSKAEHSHQVIRKTTTSTTTSTVEFS